MIASSLLTIIFCVVQVSFVLISIVTIDFYISAAHGFSEFQNAGSSVPYLVSTFAVIFGIWSKLIIGEFAKRSSKDVGWGDVFRISRQPKKIIPSLLLSPLVIGPLFNTINAEGDLVTIAIFSYQNGFFLQYVTNFSKETA